MLRNWNRLSAMARLGSVVIIIAVVSFVGYQLYDFYSDKLGFTPTKAIEAYFSALAQGDYEEVYRLTTKKDLTDIYGRPITEGEFIEQVKKVTGGRRLPFRNVETFKLVERQGSRYYVVKLHSSIGGTSGTSRLVVEVRREGNTWVLTYPFAIVL